MTTTVIAVPRSGSARKSAQKTPTTSPIGLKSSPSVRGAGWRDRYAASQMTSASFASSDGWKTAGPTWSQRLAPLTVVADREHGEEEAEAADEQRRGEGSQASVARPAEEHQQDEADQRVEALLPEVVAASPFPSVACPEVALKTITSPNATSASVISSRSCPSNWPFFTAAPRRGGGTRRPAARSP